MADKAVSGWYCYWNCLVLFREGVPYAVVSLIRSSSIGLYCGFVYHEEGLRSDFASSVLADLVLTAQTSAKEPLPAESCEEFLRFGSWLADQVTNVTSVTEEEIRETKYNIMRLLLLS